MMMMIRSTTMIIMTMTTMMMVEALVPSAVQNPVHHSSLTMTTSSSSSSISISSTSSSSSSMKEEDLSSTLPALSSVDVKQRKESNYYNKNKNHNNHNNHNNNKNMQRRKEQQRMQKIRTNNESNNDNNNINSTKSVQNDDSPSNNNNKKTNVKRNNNNIKGTTTTTTTTIRKLPESIPMLSDILEGRATFQYNRDKEQEDDIPTSTLSKTKTATDKATVKRKTKNIDSATTTTTKTATVKIKNSATTTPTTTTTKKKSSEPKTKVPMVKTETVTAKVNNKKKLSSSSSSSPPRKVKKRVEALPWRASYHSSKRTQGRIKKAFEYSPSSLPSQQRGSHAHFRAQRVLDELLETPPQYCNAVNLVCALTYSAKAMGGQNRHQHYNNNSNNKADNDNANLYLRKSLQETFDILHDLLVIHREEKLFTPRQLCNVCWAIAKHYDRDPDLILPSSQSISTSSSTSSSGKKKEEVWDWDSLLDEANVINDDDDKNKDVDSSSQIRLAQTIDEIARQLTVILFQEDEKEEKDVVVVNDGLNVKKKKPLQQPKIKLGEICMACWAYGKLKPRETPPGWPEPPQMGRVTTAMTTTTDTSPATSANNNNNNNNNNNINMSFGSFGKGSANTIIANNNNNNNNNNNGGRKDATVTDMLFDAIGYALCQSNDEKYDEVSHLNHYDTEPTIMLLEDCTWSELANVGWAFASHGRCRSRESELLLKSLAEEASNRLKDDGTIANNNNKNNQNFLVRDISQLLWTLGTLQADNFRLGDGLVLLVESLSANLRLGTKTGSRFVQGRPLRSWSCADLVQTAVALAHARIDEKLLLTALYEEGTYRLMEGSSSNKKSSSSSLTQSLVERTSNNGRLSGDNRRTFHPWEASILLWAQARLYLTEQEGIEFDEFTEDAPLFFLKALREKRGSFTECRIGPQEQANIVWSLVILEKYHSTEAIILIDLIFAEAARSCKENRSIQLEHAHQLWQAYFMLEEDCPEAVKRVPEWFVTYLKGKWSLEKARDKISSARHRSLSSTLQLMGVNHINEHDEDIDVAIILQPNAQWVHETDMDDEITDSGIDGEEDNVSVAVEFDGPNHFTRVRINDSETPAAGESPSRPDPPRALGHTVLKYRLLKKQGWTVVRVPYYEFDKIPFWASMERQRYLQRKLKTHANINFSEVDVSEYKALKTDFKSRFD
jgi:hypothetical protein